MDSEITAVIAQIETKKSELDAARDAFVQACKTFASNEINERIRSAISSNAEKVKELGEEGLAPIKKKVEEALANNDSFVEGIICQDSCWLYKQEELTTENCPFASYMVHGNRLPDIIDEPLRMLLSPAGVILLSSDLDTSEHWEKNGEIMRYRYGLNINSELKETMTAFGAKFDELYRLLEKLETLKAKKESNEALNLWDKS